MAIVPLSKVTFYGAAGEKSSVLTGLQELGCVHLVDLKGAGRRRRGEGVVSVETHQALRYLQSCPIRRRPVRDESEFRLEEVVQEAVRIEQRQEELVGEQEELQGAIGVLEPWGDFHFPVEGEFGALRLWFYQVPHYRLKTLQSCNASWQVVSRDHRFAYVVVLSPNESAGMPVPRIELDRRPLSELRERLERVEGELEELHWQRVALTRWIDAIKRSIAMADDIAARHHAACLSVDDPHIFALQGWVPKREEERVRLFADAHGLALVIEAPSESDSPPTLLENPALTAAGEDAVTFYITPAYRAWDPSSIVFVFFSVFFAMIVSDAGYALVLGGLLLLLWRRLGRSRELARMRRLALAIVIASIGYGVLIGSYFGRPAQEGSLLESLHVIDAADTGLMIRITITLGVLHLVLANLAVAWRLRGSLRMFSPLGWSAVLIGGLAVGMGQAGMGQMELGQIAVETGNELVGFGMWLLLGGLALVFLFSSERSIWTLSWRSHLGRLVDGLLALALISRAFGDVLSYLRLFALGLASAQLAATFNELTHQASGYAGVGALLAVLVATFGHGLNLALAVMGGVVHGLRLNCIEFFGWGLTEEGYPYEPFSKKAV